MYLEQQTMDDLTSVLRSAFTPLPREDRARSSCSGGHVSDSLSLTFSRVYVHAFSFDTLLSFSGYERGTEDLYLLWW